MSLIVDSMEDKLRDYDGKILQNMAFAQDGIYLSRHAINAVNARQAPKTDSVFDAGSKDDRAMLAAWKRVGKKEFTVEQCERMVAW